MTFLFKFFVTNFTFEGLTTFIYFIYVNFEDILSSWSGISTDSYKLEVFKSSIILETIDLSNKSYYMVGRLSNCDKAMAKLNYLTPSCYSSTNQEKVSELSSAELKILKACQSKEYELRKLSNEFDLIIKNQK
uniref:Uncharacterized protein n=1 Tax=Trichogramma kaykai TaxID=54128 RepID=A0ABD2XEG5_9HYME